MLFRSNAVITSEVTTAPTCEGTGVRTYTASIAADASLDNAAHSDTKEETLAAIEHDWEFVDFTWTGFTAVANYKCKNDATHTETVAATISSEVTTDPTCEGTGIRTYTANVAADASLDHAAHSDTKEETLAAIELRSRHP